MNKIVSEKRQNYVFFHSPLSNKQKRKRDTQGRLTEEIVRKISDQKSPHDNFLNNSENIYWHNDNYK